MAESNIESLQCIWSEATHSAFTDLMLRKGEWWCTFREAKAHGGGSLGTIRVLYSNDAKQWQSSAHLAEPGIDLRDPKICEMPDGRFMLVMGGALYDGSRYVTRAPRLSFSDDGVHWTAPQKVLAEDHWLWRVTWDGTTAWGVSKLGEGNDPRRGILYRSEDGLSWQFVHEFRLPDDIWNASETTLRLLPDGEMIALVRPEWIGTSRPPYVEWSWTRLAEPIGGPNFLILEDGRMWGGGRRHIDGEAQMWLARMTRTSYEPTLMLPSGGDCSYPGMVWEGERLWVSYYSSHEDGKASSIYLAQVEVAGT
ncbi:MAG: sialidase family protein [Candidatus Latescibacterota bacterium]|nr:sialidase family protein [Candidatus Latescibacterota bacterium]